MTQFYGFCSVFRNSLLILTYSFPQLIPCSQTTSNTETILDSLHIHSQYNIRIYGTFNCSILNESQENAWRRKRAINRYLFRFGFCFHLYWPFSFHAIDQRIDDASKLFRFLYWIALKQNICHRSTKFNRQFLNFVVGLGGCLVNILIPMHC